MAAFWALIPCSPIGDAVVERCAVSILKTELSHFDPGVEGSMFLQHICLQDKCHNSEDSCISECFLIYCIL
jgi:hypothetical protein